MKKLIIALLFPLALLAQDKRISELNHTNAVPGHFLMPFGDTNSSPHTNWMTLVSEFFANAPASSILTSNTLWVSKNGNDSTAKRGDFGHPFLTPLAAANAGVPGDTVFVLPGTYGVQSVLFDISTTLLRTNLNWHFFSGAILTNDFNSVYGIFDDNQNSFPDGAGQVYITGEGQFIDDFAGSAVRVADPGTRLDMTFRKIASHVNVSGGTLILRQGLIEGAPVADNAVLTAQNTASTSILDHVYLHYTNNDASGRTIVIRNGNTNTILRDCVLDAGPTATNSVVPITTGAITVEGLVSMNVTNHPSVTFYTGLYQPPLGGSGGSGGGVVAYTNVMSLSVQAAKLPTTNYPGIDAGNQNWELIYYETNAEGSRAGLNALWQFVVPPTYLTNSLSVWLQYMLDATNGPNASNVIFQAQVAKVTPGNTNNYPRSVAFSTAVSATNTWNGDTNFLYLKSMQIVLTNTINLAPRDLALLQITRDAVDDTFGGHVSLVGLQVEMVCTNILATVPPP